jgi:hypothetical protein
VGPRVDLDTVGNMADPDNSKYMKIHLEKALLRDSLCYGGPAPEIYLSRKILRTCYCTLKLQTPLSPRRQSTASVHGGRRSQRAV